MSFAYVENEKVVEVTQVDPFTIFRKEYAEMFIACPENVEAGWTYNGAAFTPPPGPTGEQIAAENKQKALLKLQETDWADLPSVSDVNNNPHLLNKAEFDAYRLEMREIAVYPPEMQILWKPAPKAQWSK